MTELEDKIYRIVFVHCDCPERCQRGIAKELASRLVVDFDKAVYVIDEVHKKGGWTFSTIAEALQDSSVITLKGEG